MATRLVFNSPSALMNRFYHRLVVQAKKWPEKLQAEQVHREHLSRDTAEVGAASLHQDPYRRKRRGTPWDICYVL